MLNKIIDLSIKNKLLVGLFVLALIGYGAWEVTRLPIDAVPDITNNQVQVITVAPSYGATDIERLITFPIEQANSNISGMQEIRSFSRFGLSLVTIVFDDETDIYWARQQVTERLQQVRVLIPQGIGSPELAPVTTGLGEIYQYVVRPKEGYEKKYNETELRTIQDWYVRRQLLGVEGVAEVSSFGGKLKQYEIAVDPNKLQSYGITVNDVFSALEKNNQNTGGAYIEKGPAVLFIRSEGLIGNKSDIENIAVKQGKDGTPLLMRAIAEIRTGHATRYGAMCYNQTGEVAGAVVMMLKGANSNKVIKNVKERIEMIQSTLPEGVIIEPFLDRTKMVNNAIGTVEKNLIEGALIVVFVLVLLLGNFRAGLLVASVIPLAMLFAIIMMNLFGVSGNLMSLGALDFGLIVDGAVIIVEAVMHRMSHFRSDMGKAQLSSSEMDNEVKHSAGKMMNSAVFGQIIILVVYLPIFTLQGIEGKMFKPMAQTVAFALLGAFILSLTYIPMMSALVLSKKTGHSPNFSDRMMERINMLYQKLLLKVLRIPKTTLLIVLGLFTISVVVLMSLGGEFIPALEEGDFAVETRVLTGSNLNTTIENSQKAVGILLDRFPEVEKIVTKIGSGEVPTDPMPMEAGDMMIILKDKGEWTSATSFNELAEKMGKAVEEVPGVTTSFQYPVQMRFNELMTGARQDVVCKIFGEDLDTLAKYAKKLGEITNGVQGAEGLFVETVTGMPQVIIEYNRNSIAQYGISIAEVNRIVNMAFAGASTGMVFEGEKRFDLVVRLQDAKRDHLEDVKNLLIPVPSGAQVPLYQLANVAIKDGPYQIQREDAKRRVIVGFNVRGRDVQSIVNELKDKVERQIKFPAGYYVNYGGAFENLNEAKKRLSIAVPVSLILIFLLLYFAFHSLRHGLLIYSAIPLSAIGGILFLALRGMPFSISAGVGFIALFGIAVLNGIVLIAEFNRLRSEGITDLHQVVLKGTGIRLRPVLMTALVASLGFLPMAISNGAGAEVQRPLATVVIGGLMIATLLTLFVLPVLYVLFEKKGQKHKVSTTSIASLLLLLSFSVDAQTSISLQAALDSTIKNNLSLRNEQLNAEMKKRLIGSYANAPRTAVGAEFGQINSAYSDNRISVTQAFSFPSVYVSNKKMLTEEWRSALSQVSVQEAEIKRTVSFVYNELSCLLQKKLLLLHADSIFNEFAQKAELRMKAGESGVLELSTAQTQRGQISIQLQDLENEIQSSSDRLRLLMNTVRKYLPEQEYKPWIADLNSDSTQIRSHPLLKYYDQQKILAGRRIAVERTGFLPEFSIGYNNMSMIGNGADNINYGSSSRFQSFQVGIGLPLFFGSQRSRLSSAKLESTVSENNYLFEAGQLQAEYRYALSRYKTGQSALAYFETYGLKNARTITAAANKQLNAGDINYLEWVMLIHQATGIYSDHLEAIRKYNESVIQLNYLTQKK